MLHSNYGWISATIVLITVGLYSCATPTTPTGGPPDEEGPKITHTEPETGTTNFSGQSITLHFSEFVERSSLREAIDIEPDVGISFEIDWGRKSAEIEFDQAIPDSTTLIINIGTDLTDTNNNSMSSPEKVAVSTGDEIDEGKIAGNIIDAQTGEGDEGERILLYREPYDLSERASYTASTDTAGTFEFSYLPEGTFKVFWVDDRNRNKTWDPDQERAQPFKEEFITLEKAQEDTIGTLYFTSTDTTKPKLQGVGLFSSQRMRMRFGEDIMITDSAEIAITDSVGNHYGDVTPLYLQPDEPYILFAHSQQSLAPDTSYGITLSGVTDQNGNEVADYEDTFTGSTQEDTTRQRVIKRNRTTGYYPDEAFEITYANIIDESAVVDSLKIVEGDSLIERWPNTETDANQLRILPQEQWKDGADYEVRIWDPLVEDYHTFNPEIWHKSQMGALNIVMEDSTLENLHLHIENEEAGFSQDTLFEKQVEIENLPPLDFKVTIYHDQNENGQWDFGRVDSFVKPEPYFIQKKVPVEKDLTGDLTVEFPN
ncbi:MAG: Ig-like domain-containing protein [Bacteroidota bacterium]